uniref:hypothetical protein n=1 Tax=uncultured Allobacillus sp. TaxID=1638025 RepID=UPI0025946F8B|nr:hypothetical protein [uncultured Allobacillus sp.]
MKVGYMRNTEEPSRLAELTAIECHRKGIELLYLRPIDIDTKNYVVKAKTFSGDKWEDVETEIPKFIDVNPYCYKKENRSVMNFLRDHTILSYNPPEYGIKKLNKYLRKDAELSNLFASKNVINGSFDFFKKFINENNSVAVFLKGKEKSPYMIHKKDHDVYEIERLTNSTHYSDEELKFLYDSVLSKEQYKMYKYFRPDEPASLFRVILQKNKDGKWDLVNTYVIEEINDIHNSTNLDNDPEESNSQFSNIIDSTDVSYLLSDNVVDTLFMTTKKLEELTNSDFMILGFNIGVTNQDDVYLYNLLFGPSTYSFRERTAEYRAGYYNHLLQSKLTENKLIKTVKKKRKYSGSFVRLINMFQKA